MREAALQLQAILALAELVEGQERFREAVAAGSGRGRILEQIRLAGAGGVAGSPAVFIGGASYFGEHDVDELASALDERVGSSAWRPLTPSP